MATSKDDAPKIYGTPELARLAGMRESSLRRLVAKLHETDGIGTKITDRAWVFTEEDVQKVLSRPDNRGKWQKDGGRRRYLEQRRKHLQKKVEDIPKG